MALESSVLHPSAGERAARPRFFKRTIRAEYDDMPG
jgi:hypothetical protein